MPVPRIDDLLNPALQALHKLGGSASIREHEDEVARILGLSDGDFSVIHKGSTTEFTYRLYWARNYLKQYGLVENSARGIWALTELGRKTTSVDKEELTRFVRQRAREISRLEVPEEGEDVESTTEVTWEEDLLDVLRNMDFSAFERLCQRLLRESGFDQVQVTGRSGDQGIDGKAVLKLGGLLSFHVRFQCKRYQGSVGSPDIRDFRGAIVGRADKGLLITTGTLTREARDEATREGALPIDYVEGPELAERLRRLGLGVHVKQETVERVTIDKDWFASL